ncbi:hypothetical protein ABFS82_07G015900 [Erythranthe guttata]
MDYRNLEITLQDAKDLNKVNLISKMDVYVVVSISGGDKKSKQKTKSPVDHDGDANPKWNFTMNFKVDESGLQANRLTLDFKLVCERALGDKDVGEVSVPIKELLDSPARPGGDGKHFVSYQVRKPNGKPKGQIAFSYQLSEKIAGAASDPYGSVAPSGKTGSEPVSSYPAGSGSVYPPPGSYPPGSGSYYSAPGSYAPPTGYPSAEGTGHYPPPAPYPATEGGGHYPPPAGYPPSGSAPPAGYPPSGSAPPAGYPPSGSGPPLGYPPSGAGPPAGYGYAPPPAYGYPPPPQGGYGYPPQQAGYGYAPPQQVVKPPKKNKFGGMGLGAGLLGGAIGGLLIGDMISDGADFDCGGMDF